MPPDQRKVAAIVSRLLAWYSCEARDLPWRRTRDPYAIWVAEIMLQQTQVKTVIPFWERWMRDLPNVQALAEASPAKIHKLWEGLGYYTRVRNLQRAARIICAEHNGRFPDRFEQVLELPGIGRYTAGAICSIAFNQPQPILDGNVVRVLTRLFGVRGNAREKETQTILWNLAERLVIRASSLASNNGSNIKPPRTTTSPCSSLNQALMELGALVCTPKSPQCPACPARRFCVARKLGIVDQLPEFGPAMAITRRRFAAFVVERNGRFLVRQRPHGVVNGHLWEFPNLELESNGTALPELARTATGLHSRGVKRLFQLKHSITRYRIELDVFRVEPRNGKTQRPSSNGHRWLPPASLKRLAFASAHKKILERVIERNEAP